MLAHRGWEVYLLSRDPSARSADNLPEQNFASSVNDAIEASAKLGDKLILFGADVGASIALQAATEHRPMAMALFAPSTPAALGRRYAKTLGFLGRRKQATSGLGVTPPQTIARRCRGREDICAEPRALISELQTGVTSIRPNPAPPAIVFVPGGDALVDTQEALAFAKQKTARAAAMKLAGRWWPSLQGPNVADEVHRFLILTLGDRVVDFPDEIIED